MSSVRIALISVWDKTGIVPLARGLDQLGYTLVATGKSRAELQAAGLPVVSVEQLTGVPEILGGRVKTLHPAVHGGILARRNRPEDLKTLLDFGVAPVDVVVVNLYPFGAVVAEPGATLEDAIESIDVGGVAMLRAAAKSHQDVWVAVDPLDYPLLLRKMAEPGGHAEMRKDLAVKAFQYTAAYDAAIGRWLDGGSALAPAGLAATGGTVDAGPIPWGVADAPSLQQPPPADAAPQVEGELHLALGNEAALRYGENPHQSASLWRDLRGDWVQAAPCQVLHGKPLSYNNLVDADVAWSAALELPPHLFAAVVVKHGNPCGAAAMQMSMAAAVLRAIDADPVSAYGGIVALNRPLDLAAARALADKFLEVILAPSFEDEALELLAAKPSLRLVAMGMPHESRILREVKVSHFGVLVQSPDDHSAGTSADLLAAGQLVTTVSPLPVHLGAMAVAWSIVKYVKSNAIVLADEYGTVGIGAGQMSRVDAAVIAAGKCRKGYKPLVAASDGFFPFTDGLDVLVRAGVKVIVQPGGSKRDDEVISAANAAGLAMVMTGQRRFRH